MACHNLAFTGAPLALIVVIAAGFLIAGAALLLTARSRRSGRSGAPFVLLALIVFASGVAGAPAAKPALASCGIDAPAVRGDLEIVQTSTNAGLAPGVAPAPITGRITNPASRAVYVHVVTVGISSVDRSPSAARGGCDASDYVIVDPTMPVYRTIGPGKSLNFGGAAIGFRTTSLDQDACQRAHVKLVFVSS